MKPFLEKYQVNLNLEYQSRIVSVKLPQYKTIYHIKELAKEAFFILRQDIHLTHLNRDITKLDHCLIGDFFKGKNNIFIKVSIDSNNLQASKGGAKKGQDNSLYLCVCKNDIIYNYCRACKMFICNICRVNSVHAKHKVVQVDINNLEESAKLYAITLQSDILYNLKIVKEYYNQATIRKSWDDSLSRHEKIKAKYDRVAEIYREMISKLYANPNLRSDEIESLIKEYQINTKTTNQDLEEILHNIFIKYTKPKKKMNFEEFKKYYETIHHKEEEIDQFSLKILAYRVNYEMNNKMNKMYDQIEEILDGMLSSSSPLSLDPNTYSIYELLTKGKGPITKTTPVVPKETKKLTPSKEMKFKDRIVLVAKDRDKNDTRNIDKNAQVDFNVKSNLLYDQEVDVSQSEDENGFKIEPRSTMRQRPLGNDEDGIMELP